MAKRDDCCDILCFDEVKVNRVRADLENQDTLTVASMFKALSDDTRMKIAYSLCTEDELCVCDVANIIGSSVATASHHLRLLKNMGITKYRKEGKLVFYSLDDEHVRQLVMLAMAHSKEVVTNG
ncbi:ArsR/SmtB family transcription factor [Brevibacillus panacihumi]|uniref:ArsR/SmtB family transcription factor n=1 Tax=Brevibacillus panacihumi TaxID=497735 RepID=UPI003D07DB55